MTTVETKDQRTTPDMQDPRAVFAGLRGEILVERYHNPHIYRHHLYYDEAGNLIPIKAGYIGRDPATIPGFSREGYVEFGVGEVVVLPVWDATALAVALATGNFCRLDAQEEISKAHQEAFEATEAEGAVTLEPYRTRIAQLKTLLEVRDWIFKPVSVAVETAPTAIIGTTDAVAPEVSSPTPAVTEQSTVEEEKEIQQSEG